MILSMNSQDLLEGLNTVTRALSPRPAKQILEGVLISAEENRVLMTCSDGSLTIEYTNTASVQEDEFDDRPADYESKLDKIDKLILEISEQSDQ